MCVATILVVLLNDICGIHVMARFHARAYIRGPIHVIRNGRDIFFPMRGLGLLQRSAQHEGRAFLSTLSIFVASLSGTIPDHSWRM